MDEDVNTLKQSHIRLFLRLVLLTLAIDIAAMTHVENAECSQILIGLRNRGVYVQEYWSGDEPYYAVANVTDSSVQLQFQNYTYKDDGVRFYDDQYGPIVAAWHVQANQVGHYRASQFKSMNLVHVLSNGESLGLLVPPIWPEKQHRRRIRTYGGLNIGASRRPDQVWIEQRSLAFKPLSNVDLTLKVRSGLGRIGFGPYVGLWRLVNNRETGLPRENQGLERLELTSLDCASLPVNLIQGVHVVDTQNPLSEKQIHEVRLRFEMPANPGASMVQIVGFHWDTEHDGPNGYFLTRGILVER